MKLLRKVGATSQIFQIFIADSSSTTGAGLSGLTSGSSNLIAYYHRDTDTTATAIALTTMTVGTFTSSGFAEIDATHMKGWYQFCPPNTALATGAASCAFHLGGATNMAPLPIEVDLDAQVDVTFWNGTVVATPATAGIPDINVKNMNNVAATSITTINANVGQTQPVNFTGTAGSALVKVDAIDLAGQTITAAAGVTFPSSVASPTNITAGTITTVSGNVNGSVNSVTTDVGITQAAADKVFGASGAAMAELTGVPSATPSPRNAMMLLFMTLRNKLTTTASVKTIFNDANASITTKALSDNGTVYTEDKMA